MLLKKQHFVLIRPYLQKKLAQHGQILTWKLNTIIQLANVMQEC